MRKYYILFILLNFNNINAQERKSFKLDDVILLRNSNLGDVHDFLKSRYLTFVKKMEDCNAYALNYEENKQSASFWCYKYQNGKIKLLEAGEGEIILFIKRQLKPFKKETNFADDGWVETFYKYKNHKFFLRENDLNSKYEMYVE